MSYLERLSLINCDTVEKTRLHVLLFTFYKIYNKNAVMFKKLYSWCFTFAW